MTIHEFFIKRWESEQPAFSKVLRAIPGEQLDYKPHERSTSAGDLAWQLALEQQQMSEIVERGEVHFEPPQRPATVEEILAVWDKATEEIRSRLPRLDEATCAREAKFFVGGKAVWTATVGDMLWGYLFDMVHHRGQMSAYLRPMGAKVPSIYGPSADDSGS